MHVPGHGLWAMRRHWSSFALTNLGKKEAHKQCRIEIVHNFYRVSNFSNFLVTQKRIRGRGRRKGEKSMHHPWNSAGTLLGKSSSKTWSKGKSFEPSLGRTASGHAVNVSQSVMANWWEEAILWNFDAKTLYGAKKGSFWSANIRTCESRSSNVIHPHGRIRFAYVHEYGTAMRQRITPHLRMTVTDC
ncbi:hypothetical protein B0T13DRAFT_450696 [Neurospora crassa]|nr:hypothetical protein B0T13DRAFT_450696 [Neurospora crassa]